MPRRNAVTRPRNGRQSHDHATHEHTMTCEQMARSLVQRGLASKYILSVYRGDHTPDEM